MLTTTATDIALWHKVRMDDQAAFNVLFDRYWISLYKTAHHYLDDEDECAQVVNDIFVSIWNRRKELEISFFYTFMQTSVRFQIYKRRKAAKLKLVFKEEVDADVLHESNTGEKRVQQQEFNRELSGYLDKLPKRCQEIFELRHIEQLSNQEIAERLNISKRTVENQMALALKHLKLCFKYMSFIIFFYIK
jgi:RNA polymerase sigma-70 factor (family 1)